MADKKRIRIFAGPNGSGKSTLKELIGSLFKLGIYVNADDMLVSMRDTSRLEFSNFGLNVDPVELENALSTWTIPIDHSLWVFDNNGISVKDPDQIDGYLVSFLADFIRNSLLGKVDRFSFETVMSHPSKLDFMKRARAAGYKVYFYFVSLPDPDLNVLRVRTRVSEGGHDVHPDKIRSRYYRTMDLLLDAIRLADSVYLFDNSSSKPQLFARMENGQLRTEGTFIPGWYQTYVLDKLNNKARGV